MKLSLLVGGRFVSMQTHSCPELGALEQSSCDADSLNFERVLEEIKLSVYRLLYASCYRSQSRLTKKSITVCLFRKLTCSTMTATVMAMTAAIHHWSSVA